jgi:hypothetical protein
VAKKNKWEQPSNPPPPLFTGEKERNLVKKINDEDGATALTKQVMIKSIIDGLRPEAYRSFNVDEGEE